jgi:hypothetical protein
MFSLFESPDSPRTWENYGHGGSDRPGGVTGIHWGTGSAVASTHIVRPTWGDAYIDEGGWGVGIDGCTVTGVSIEGSTIAVGLKDIVGSPRPVLLRFGPFPGKTFTVVVNGQTLGAFTDHQLLKGVHADLE